MDTKDFQTMTAEAKEKINSFVLNGLKVLNVPPDILCSHCGLVPVFHYVFFCSHVYCRNCYSFYVKEKIKCRKCRASVTDKKASQSRKIEYTVNNLQSECPNSDKGCNDVITLQYMLEHKENCKFETDKLFPKLYAENSTDTSQEKMHQKRENLEKEKLFPKLYSKTSTEEPQEQVTQEPSTHEISEEFLRKSEFSEKINELVAQLEKQSADIVEMRNRVAAAEAASLTRSENNMNRLENMLANLKVQIESQECSIREINTTIRSTNEQVMQDIESNISTCYSQIEQLRNSNLEMESSINTIQSQEAVTIQQSQQESINAVAAMKVPKSGVIVWKINEFRKKKDLASTLADNKSLKLHSYEFYSSEYGYKMKLKVEFSKDHLGVFMIFVKGENDVHLPAVFHHRKTYFILDQSDQKEKRHIISVTEPRFRDCFPERWMKVYNGYPKFCTYTLLETKYKEVYLKDDSIFVKVIVEPIFPLNKSPFSNDGILIWKVLNYTRTKQESQDEICTQFYSDFFYSSKHGYRMQCFLVFDENILSIWLCFLEGEFDDLLPNIYAHKVTFSICDQINKSEHNNMREVRTLDPMVIGNEKAKEKMSACGYNGACFLFSTVEKSPFYVEDSILVKIDVTPM